MHSEWYVYILECADGSYYTGITIDVQRRLNEHNSGRGAKYTRGRGPCQLVGIRVVSTRSEALILEARIKRTQKNLKLVTLLESEIYATSDKKVCTNSPLTGIEPTKG